MKDLVKATYGPVAALSTMAALVLLALFGIVEQFAPGPLAAAGGRAAFVLLCLSSLHRAGTRELTIVAISLVLAGALWYRDGNLRAIADGLDKAAFFAAFIYLVTLLKEAAQLSSSVLRLGRYLTGQPSGRRYYSLAFGGHMLGILLNFGAISLLTPLIQRGAREIRDPVLAANQERQQISALIRGFSWILLWSPTALTQVVISSSFPAANSFHVFWLGVASAVMFMLLGRVCDRIEWPKSTLPVRHEAQPFPATAAKRFSFVCAVLVAATIATMLAAGVSAAIALMLVSPVMTVLWLVAQNGRLRPALVQLGTIWSASAPSLASIAITLGLAGFIGHAAALLVPAGPLAAALERLDLPGWCVLVTLPVIITLFGQVAISPLVIVVFLASLLNQLHPLPADPVLVCYTLAVGWSLSMTLSPNASATLLISGVTRIPPTTLTWRWNGAYGLAAYSVFAALIFLLATFWPGG